MNKRLKRLWHDVTGRGSDVFVDLLAEQVDLALTAARVLAEAHLDGREPPEVTVEVRELENAGDQRRTAMLEELARALVTPIDREDLFRLSHSLDDVLDNLQDFAIEVECYGGRYEASFVGPLEALVEGLRELGNAIERLRDDASDTAAAARSAKHANDAREAYHEAMADLLRGELTMDTLRRREQLRRHDVTGLRLGEAADALTSGALKRG